MAVDLTALRPASDAGPVMLLSVGRRDELVRRLKTLGWDVIGARRVAGLAARAERARASVVLIDSVGTGARASEALLQLGQSVAGRVVLYEGEHAAQIANFIAGGATHLLPDTSGDLQMATTLRAASRILERQVKQPTDVQRDAMTGLISPATLKTWINGVLDRSPVAVLLVNVLRFDTINAAFGRDVGDAILRTLAHRIEPLVADLAGVECALARLPGAEFAIAISGDIKPERLQLLGEAIVESASRPLSAESEIIRLGCRIIGVQAQSSDKGAAQLLRRASHILGQFRSSAAGPVQLMIGERSDLANQSLSLHADLRNALAAGEIEILFQPQVSTLGNRIEGVEALARWQHPVHGQIGAVTLFTVAEQSNYLLELSAYVQRRALTLAAAWPPELAHLRLSLNVTANDLSRTRFAQQFLASVDESGFPRGRLTVEVTESGVMANVDAAAKKLAQLRAAGCRVAIDDFGTGYSSLAWLKSLPADYLKLDKGLSGDILGGERDAVVIRGVIEMARSLGLTVIAEGIESENQRSLLAQEGCTLFQGFLFARPLDLAGLIALVGASGRSPTLVTPAR